MNLQLDLKSIEKWAYTTEVDEAFDRYIEDFTDWFEVQVGNACSLNDLFRFTADARCLRRRYFAGLLVTDLCWIYRVDLNLPFHFSRLQGLVGRADYLSDVVKRAEAIYERSEIIEQMRLSGDPALQSLANALLDYRNEKIERGQSVYLNLLRQLHRKIPPLFTDA
ncbi:hypothetical protein [Lysobacter capsici]|uniref:hypothetical protein n=1 Tax=Lysobacter capsici TaxID=435897 RepID=UPI00044AF93A|nr:hypothetical protein [Lysobacter capsici]